MNWPVSPNTIIQQKIDPAFRGESWIREDFVQGVLKYKDPFRRVICAIAHQFISPHSSMCPEWILNHPMHGLMYISDYSTGGHCPDEFGETLEEESCCGGNKAAALDFCCWDTLESALKLHRTTVSMNM